MKKHIDCLKLLHEYDATIQAWEQNTNEDQCAIYRAQNQAVATKLEALHDGAIPSWDQVENC